MRAAIYYVPAADDPLTQRAAAWLGRDAAGGAVPPRPAVAGLDAASVEALTAAPRRYGFHATLKAPFRLAAGADLEELDRALRAFAAGAAAAALPPLSVQPIDGFLALAPVGPAPQAEALAAAVVRRFEPFRAPLSAAERTRRAAGLTPHQTELLDEWGYPYVFDEFRFHMTLTGPVPVDRQAALLAALRAEFADLAAMPRRLDGLALFVEPEPGAPFRLHSRHRVPVAVAPALP